MARSGGTAPGAPALDVPGLLGRCTFPPPGTPLVCAVSGGPDSLALLVLAVAAGCEVTAVHVDHGLRRSSAAEADVVAAAAAALGARFRGTRVEVAPGANLEARARAARRAALPAGSATGHTMDDQAETVLVNLLRGAGLDGLAGMVPGPDHPLLAVRRAETHALCQVQGLEPWRTRPTRTGASCATASATSCSPWPAPSRAVTSCPSWPARPRCWPTRPGCSTTWRRRSTPATPRP